MTKTQNYSHMPENKDLSSVLQHEEKNRIKNQLLSEQLQVKCKVKPTFNSYKYLDCSSTFFLLPRDSVNVQKLILLLKQIRVFRPQNLVGCPNCPIFSRLPLTSSEVSSLPTRLPFSTEGSLKSYFHVLLQNIQMFSSIMFFYAATVKLNVLIKKEHIQL